MAVGCVRAQSPHTQCGQSPARPQLPPCQRAAEWVLSPDRKAQLRSILWLRRKGMKSRHRMLSLALGFSQARCLGLPAPRGPTAQAFGSLGAQLPCLGFVLCVCIIRAFAAHQL